ncbi:hypothetical protein SAMN02745857_01497 [Andreprevotia lacus DSM 23236]|jgi:hypothetical protein|uniref:HAMP domain-containing protein n=1 Tax=Andreprevotia lacus DSM 23236 TaxID=1121001 RepID=A0A1W1XFX2_9NEIS|nr:hypothetical protein [Andreprevotia lacus]SMC22875.1 hypothetical protein SAMN02745857_01497 [Andreprevotia lacus DSM 23236]
MLSRALPRHWPLWLQLGLPIALVICLSVGLITFLNFFNYQKSYRQLQLGRYQVLGKDVRQAIESGLNVGLDPAANARLEGLLQQLRKESAGVQFMAVVDEGGRQLVSNGSLPAGQDWSANPASAPAQADWQKQDDTLYYLGLPYRNSFGVVVGALIIGYPRAQIDAATNQMRLHLLRLWGLVSLAVFMLAPLGVWVLTRRMSRELDVAAKALDHALDDDPPALPEFKALGEELAQDIPQFIRSSRESAQLLHTAKQEQQS